MSDYDRRHRAGDAAPGPGTAVQRAPGRQSTTAGVQRRAAAASSPAGDTSNVPLGYLTGTGAGTGAAAAPAAHDDPFAMHEIAAQGVSGGGGGALPHGDTIAASFGKYAPAVHGIRAHVGGDAAAASSAIGAEAYTTGSSIAFTQQPDLALAAHEAAHVVQQAGGVQLKGGVGQSGDAYERHADAVAAEVVAGRSAEPLLDQMAGGGGGGAAGAALQRKDVPTHFGTFKSTTYTKFETRGVDAVIEFHPDPAKIDASKIGLTQSVKATRKDGSQTAIDPTKEGRRVTGGAGAGYTHDRISTKNNPIYGAEDLGAGKGLSDTKKDNNDSGDPTKVATDDNDGNATYQLGHAYKDGGAQKTKEASLYDQPKGGSKWFETAALGLEGRDTDTYFGSVKWGYDLNPAGTDVTITDIELASMGVPTQNFLASAALWNASTTQGTLEVTADPAKAKKESDMSAVDVAKGTKAKQLSTHDVGGKPAVKVETLAADGSPSGNKYFIFVTDLKDAGDGGATANLPMHDVFVNPAQAGFFSDPELKTKVKDLPANTRMENTECTIHGSYGMKIVDGPDIGTKGYIEFAKIKRER